jgi:hypothetical protein
MVRRSLTSFPPAIAAFLGAGETLRQVVSKKMESEPCESESESGGVPIL